MSRLQCCSNAFAPTAPSMPRPVPDVDGRFGATKPLSAFDRFEAEFRRVFSQLLHEAATGLARAVPSSRCPISSIDARPAGRCAATEWIGRDPSLSNSARAAFAASVKGGIGYPEE